MEARRHQLLITWPMGKNESEVVQVKRIFASSANEAGPSMRVGMIRTLNEREVGMDRHGLHLSDL